MKYKAIYLPVDKPLTDGCKIINSSGEVFTYTEDNKIGWAIPSIKVAEMFLVKEEYNQRIVVGYITPDATKWVTPGMEFKTFECVNIKDDEDQFYLPTFSIVCPTCKTKH